MLSKFNTHYQKKNFQQNYSTINVSIYAIKYRKYWMKNWNWRKISFLFPLAVFIAEHRKHGNTVPNILLFLIVGIKNNDSEQKKNLKEKLDCLYVKRFVNEIYWNDNKLSF